MPEFQDSTGNAIRVGDTVKFRGKHYTISKFIKGEGRLGTSRIEFKEPQHTPENADEVSVDLVTINVFLEGVTSEDL